MVTSYEQVAGEEVIVNREEKLEILKELDDLPEEVYDELLVMLSASLDDHMLQIEQALAQGDADHGRAQAHAMKGAAANLRILAVQERAAAVEQAFQDRTDSQGLQLLVQELRKAVLQLAAEVATEEHDKRGRDACCQ